MDNKIIVLSVNQTKSTEFMETSRICQAIYKGREQVRGCQGMEPEEIRLVRLQRNKRNPLKMRGGHIHYFYCDDGFTDEYLYSKFSKLYNLYQLHSNSS